MIICCAANMLANTNYCCCLLLLLLLLLLHLLAPTRCEGEGDGDDDDDDDNDNDNDVCQSESQLVSQQRAGRPAEQRFAILVSFAALTRCTHFVACRCRVCK